MSLNVSGLMYGGMWISGLEVLEDDELENGENGRCAWLLSLSLKTLYFSLLLSLCYLFLSLCDKVWGVKGPKIKGSCSLFWQTNLLVSEAEWSAGCWSRDSPQQEAQSPEQLGLCLEQEPVFVWEARSSLVSSTDKLASRCQRWVNPLSVWEWCKGPISLVPPLGQDHTASPVWTLKLDLYYRRDLHKAPDTASNVWTEDRALGDPARLMGFKWCLLCETHVVLGSWMLEDCKICWSL